MKNNKTLVVITFFERKDTLDIQLKFLAKYDENVDIVLVDQSEDTWSYTPNDPKIINLHHFPASRYNFYEMWRNICQIYDDYSFIFWNNDDDFVSLSAIKKAEQFLLQNENYSMASGQVVQIMNDGSINWEYGTSEWLKQDVNDKTALGRVKTGFKNLHVNPHALIRLDTWKKAIDMVLDTVDTNHSLAPIRFWDKIITVVSLIDGHRKTNLECVSTIRTHGYMFGRIIEKVHYPKTLEKNTAYCEILSRLQTRNPIAEMLSREHGVEHKIAHNTIIDSMNGKNICFSKFTKTVTPVEKDDSDLKYALHALRGR